jgi:hypothetical protein
MTSGVGASFVYSALVECGRPRGTGQWYGTARHGRKINKGYHINRHLGSNLALWLNPVWSVQGNGCDRVKQKRVRRGRLLVNPAARRPIRVFKYLLFLLLLLLLLPSGLEAQTRLEATVNEWFGTSYTVVDRWPDRHEQKSRKVGLRGPVSSSALVTVSRRGS